MLNTVLLLACQVKDHLKGLSHTAWGVSTSLAFGYISGTASPYWVLCWHCVRSCDHLGLRTGKGELGIDN